MIVPRNWEQAVVELIGMIQAADECTTPRTYDWARGELVRMGRHLDGLPFEHRADPPTLDAFVTAKVELASAC